MSVTKPHFLLHSQASERNHQGEWTFSLQAADGSATLEANDTEPELRGERLELLAVVRGLEALEQPSRVTLVTTSKYVNRGLAYGLEEWRSNDWTWESFGEMVPIKNRDLWLRVDRALRFHQLELGPGHIDTPHGPPAPHFRLPAKRKPVVDAPAEALAATHSNVSEPAGATRRNAKQRGRLAIRLARRWRLGRERMALALRRLGTPHLGHDNQHGT
jgi:ribonuclease HI